jgi:hypothetical protein
MSLVSTLKYALTASREKPGAGSSDGPTGAFWCTECDERLVASAADVAPDSDGEQSCPSCGSAMRFERAPDSGGCAC